MVRFYIVAAVGRPTFILDGTIQGIVSEEHAAKVAADVTGLPIEKISVAPAPSFY